MDLANAAVAQLMIPVEDFDRGVSFYRDILGIPFLFAAPKSELWLSEFTDPDGNQLALMAELALADA